MKRYSQISLVIPVYNEAEHLGACLQAIAAQTVAPLEVIVVDNNSTDESAAVAASFDFVTLLREPRQGVVHARNRGFDAARGEIIGRIDADTLLPPGWVAQVPAFFQDPAVGAISGAPHYYDFAFPKVADLVDRNRRAHLANKLGRTNFLWGANMAVRRSAWRRVRGSLCTTAALHEDFDLGIHLQRKTYQVLYEPSLVAGVSSRRINTSFRSFARYTLVSPRTYAAHDLNSRRHMYPIILLCWLCHVPARFIYRAYDPSTGNFSFSRFGETASPRIDPTVNVA